MYIIVSLNISFESFFHCFTTDLKQAEDFFETLNKKNLLYAKLIEFEQENNFFSKEGVSLDNVIKQKILRLYENKGPYY